MNAYIHIITMALTDEGKSVDKRDFTFVFGPIGNPSDTRIFVAEGVSFDDALSTFLASPVTTGLNFGDMP